jgi:hypothetical protein
LGHARAGEKHAVRAGFEVVFSSASWKSSAVFLQQLGREVPSVLLAVNREIPWLRENATSAANAILKHLCSVTEHRLTKDHADRFTVKSSCKTSIDPGFSTVCIPLTMKQAVGFSHLFHNPSARLSIPWLACTKPDDLIKAVVDSNFACESASNLAKVFQRAV